MVLIVQFGNSLSQWPNTGSWAVLSAMGRDINLLGPVKAAFDVVVDLGSTLTQVCPLIGLL